MPTLVAAPPSFNWIALVASITKASADFKANAPLVPVPASSNPNIGATLKAVLPYIHEAADAIKAHPGAITAVDDVLTALRAQGCLWAGDLEDAIDATPGALAEAESWIPTIIGFLGAFKPAAIGVPGSISGARGHI